MTVLNDRDKRVERLFHESVGLPIEERETFLQQHCADESIRAKVRRLLAFDHREGGGLTDHTQHETQEDGELDAPATIGPYKLLQRIGEGGMGVVHMAEQVEPIRRRVALKIVKPGMDSQQVIARFEAERQALALMDHPNIAKVLDAGQTEAGRPYFVMELVKGVPITKYCDDHRLSTPERLRLFAAICRAVQHAHQKGIIHRDLKPSNVLLAEYDHEPVVKVIDFGVAKAINQELTARTLFTQYGQIVGTLEYMSPEQAKFNQQDIDTRSDVYSLGVLLHELLTGATPIEKNSLKSSAFDEILRLIREVDPPRPSTRLSSSDALPGIAANRNTEPGKLVRQLRDDLDWIIIKALAKERDERYQTAEALAADVDRHLRGLPIEARAPSTVGRLRRLVRRHRTTAALTGLVLLTSLTAVALGTVAYVEKLKQAKQQADLLITQTQAELTRLRAQRMDTAHKVDVPRVKQLIEERRTVEAYQLAKATRNILPEDPALEELWQNLTVQGTFQIEPEGTEIYYRDARCVGGDWILAGKSPLIDARLPKCELRFRYVKAGYRTKEFQRPFPIFLTWSPNDTLRADQEDPEEMVFINGEPASQWNNLPTDMAPFLIDRCEVSNREYQSFVDAGGYENPKYWTDVKFVRDDVELSWSEAMRVFVDSTGQARGPAGWREGRFPPGEDDYAVTGVSWFEAMAFAKFAKKSLPTVHHWRWAGLSENVGITTSLSNFSDTGLSPRGKHIGIGRFEVYDMAGNAKEWCWNEHEDGVRCLKGGAWNESEYRFTMSDYAAPWNRDLSHGFRCVRYLSDTAPEELTLAPVPKDVRAHPEVAREPIDVLRKWYTFDRLPLNVEQAQFDDADPSPDYRHEIVRVDAAYENERLEIHLFIPRGKQEKYETVVWVPGRNCWNSGGVFSAQSYSDMKYVIDLPKTGRIVCHPIYKGTFQRFSGVNFQEQFRKSPLQAREDFIAVSKDVSRAVDYLLTRNDVDGNRLVYFGHSLGAYRGPATLATDSRFTAAVLLSGGYADIFLWCPEIDNYNFTPHVKTPVLMINGVADTIGVYESSQRPFYEDLGSTVKEHVPLLTGHNPPAKDVLEEMVKWLEQLYARADPNAGF